MLIFPNTCQFLRTLSKEPLKNGQNVRKRTHLASLRQGYKYNKEYIYIYRIGEMISLKITEDSKKEIDSS